MSEDYEFIVKVFLPTTQTTFECKDWKAISGGVRLIDVENYNDDVTILNTPVIITTELHGGLGAGTVQN